MAFTNRLGNILGRTISQNAVLNGQSSMASMFNAIRCMSSSRLFVGGLSYSTDEQSLKNAFSSFGQVVDAKVVTDRESGRSRGFGFVGFDSEESAKSAMSSMDGQQLDGRNIRISFANDNNRGGGGGGGGGYAPRGGFRENDGGY